MAKQISISRQICPGDRDWLKALTVPELLQMIYNHNRFLRYWHTPHNKHGCWVGTIIFDDDSGFVYGLDNDDGVFDKRGMPWCPPEIGHLDEESESDRQQFLFWAKDRPRG